MFNAITNAYNKAKNFFSGGTTQPQTSNSNFSSFVNQYQQPKQNPVVASVTPPKPQYTQPAGPVAPIKQPVQPAPVATIPQSTTTYQAPAKITSQNFSVDTTPNTYDSSVLSGTSNRNTLMDTYNKKRQDMISGANIDLLPSDTYMGKIANQVYTLSQYTPQEAQQLQNFADLNSRISATQLAERRQIKQLQEDGRITKEQAASFISESQRRADAQLADLAVAQQASSNTLGVLGQIRQNQLTAYQNLAGYLKPEQVSVGSTLYNPIQGVMYQPGADAQNTIAQGLVDGLYSPNNLPAGVNPAVVLQQANQLSLAQKGVPFNANESQANFQAQQAAIQQNATTYRTLSNAQKAASDHITEALGYAKDLSGTSRFPVLNSVALATLRAVGNKTVGQYDTALAVARSEIAKVLGGGQVTVEGMQEAERILPSNLGADQLEAKIKTIQSLMDAKVKEYESLTNIPQFGQTPATTGGKIIQTSVGAVDNSWFN